MVIRFQQVTYQYNSFVRADAFSLKNISLSIKGGEFILLAGQTGSGKTTFLRLLDTLILPTTGEIDFADDIVDSRSSEKKVDSFKKTGRFGFSISTTPIVFVDCFGGCFLCSSEFW